MADKRSVRFLALPDEAGLSPDELVGAIEVDDITLVRGGEAQSLTADQEKRVRAVAPPDSLEVDDRGSASKKKEE